MDIGETFAQSVVREVKEETGFDVRIDRIVGIYSDPGHVFAYEDGEVRQEFNICLTCTIVGGEPTVSSESTDVQFFSLDEVAHLTMHESIRKRIEDYLGAREAVLRLVLGNIIARVSRACYLTQRMQTQIASTGLPAWRKLSVIIDG
jgi:ADP-ribose pyrophosphatase YjhB (NUDIX family)